MRFIPTPVGNASATSSKFFAHSVHPHARGECVEKDAWYPVAPGSSPRPWGMLFDRGTVLFDVRFIPTPVGNAHSLCLLLMLASVHPHARGECRYGPRKD